MRTPRIVLYPFLIALYLVLALAAANAREIIWLRNLVWPVVIAIGVALAAWILSRVVSRDVHLRALVALAVVIWFSCYGYFQHALATDPWLYAFSAREYAIPGFLLLLCAAVYLVVRRYPRPLAELSRYLDAASGVLVLFPVWTLLRAGGVAGKSSHVQLSDRMPDTSFAHVTAQSRPSIYIIILDEYTGTRALARNYGFDNRPFEDTLRRLGFIVPASPHANYVHTHLALAAMLNWRLLDDRPAQLTASDGALALDYAAIEDSRTWQFSHDLGYRMVFLPSVFRGTAQNRHADLQLPDPEQVTSEFETAWRGTTLATPVRDLWCRTVGCRAGLPFKPPPADLIEWKFHQLAQLPDSAGPLFVFAHFVLPHWPYIFNADCTHREPYRPEADSGAEEPAMKRAYAQQIQCVNQQVSQLVQTLIAKSRTPPIIVLQGDHGHGRFGHGFPALADADPVRVEERIEPFAAYYLPGHPGGVVYDSITPVNVLPRIFDYYFHAGIPLQPDMTFWSTYERPFQFTRIR